MAQELDPRALRKVAEATTPGEWKAKRGDLDSGDVWGRSEGIHEPWIATAGDRDNAEFIATFDPPTVLALLSRLEQAEQAVARVREMAEEMGEGKAFGILTRGREDEYPISYFIEMLEEALDGEPNE